eukprot:1545533-Prymnesium_polylepis.3
MSSFATSHISCRSEYTWSAFAAAGLCSSRALGLLAWFAKMAHERGPSAKGELSQLPSMKCCVPAADARGPKTLHWGATLHWVAAYGLHGVGSAACHPIQPRCTPRAAAVSAVARARRTPQRPDPCAALCVQRAQCQTRKVP